MEPYSNVMQSRRRILAALVISGMIVVAIAKLNDYAGDRTFAQSSPSSFIYEEIIDNYDDWQNITLKDTNGNLLTDILSVTFFSDGRNINATIWLHEPFYHNDRRQTISKSNLTFGILIDADFNVKTGTEGIDYNIAINREYNKSSNNSSLMYKWTKVFEQWSSNLLPIERMEKRVVDIENATDIFAYRKNFIHISLDAEKIGFPNQYRIIFYTIEKRGGGIPWILDFTKWLNIPGPNIEVSTEPTSLDLVAGENKTVELKIKSSTGFKPEVNLYAINLPHRADAGFTYNNLTVPTFGQANTPMWLKFPSDADPRPYIITILTNSTIPEESIEGTTDLNEEFLIPPLERKNIENMTSVSNLAVNLHPPLTGLQHAINIISQWQWIIAIGLGIIIDRFIPWNKVIKSLSKKDTNTSGKKY